MKRMTFGLLIALLIMFFSLPAAVMADKPLELTLTSFGVGSNFHTMSTALANAVRKTTGIRTNVTPAGNDTSRLLPLRNGEAELTILSVSTGWLASHGASSFASEQWGPQPLRVAWRGGDYDTAFWTKGDSGIKSLKDIKGKRVGQVPGSPTINGLMKGAVAFGGYSIDDVVVVNASGYAAGAKATMHGSIDVYLGTPTASVVREVAASRGGIWWFDLDPKDKAAWERMLKFCPWAGHGVVETYPGREKRNTSFNALTYSQGLWSWSTTDENKIYQYAKALWDNYDEYKDKHPRLKGWDHKTVADTTSQYWPYHPGLIKLLKEKGVWTAKHDNFQENQLKREAQRMALWEKTKTDLKGKGVKLGSEECQQAWWDAMEKDDLLQ